MPHGSRLRLVALATLLLAGCASVAPSSPGPTPSSPGLTPSPSVEQLVPPCPGWVNRWGLDPTTPEQLANAVRFRQEMGLPSDPELVAMMACRQDANVDFGGAPITAAEFAEIQRRGRNTDAIIGTVLVYTSRHPDEFGGLYIDHSRGGLLTVLWTARLAEHEAAIRAELQPSAPLAFRQVRWSEKALRALQDRVAADLDWFKDIPAAPGTVGVDVIRNNVEIGISSANPDAAALITAHYAIPEGMITVISDGTGAVMLPFGTVKGVVVRRDGRLLGGSVGSLIIQARAGGPPGWCGRGDMGGVMPDGAFEYPCQVGVRVIQVIEIGDVLPHRVLGEARVEVPAGGVVFTQIVIDAPKQP